jgi:hypothetical protein
MGSASLIKLNGPWRHDFSELATAPACGLSLSHWHYRLLPLSVASFIEGIRDIAARVWEAARHREGRR